MMINLFAYGYVKRIFKMAYNKKTMKKNTKKKMTGKRSKLDVNKNGKIDKEDFKLLRSRKKKPTAKKKGAKNGRQK